MSLTDQFYEYRDHLEVHRALRERVIAVNRDVTAASKKIIFALHRINNLEQPVPANVARDIANLQSTIDSRLGELGADFEGPEKWRYARNLSGGVQEYVEAQALKHYLETQKMISLAGLKATLPDFIEVSDEDFVLGLLDATGELMRYALGHLVDPSQPGSRRASPIAQRICTTLREFDIALQGVDVDKLIHIPAFKELQKKLDTFRACLVKVESALFSLAIRGERWSDNEGAYSAP